MTEQTTTLIKGTQARTLHTGTVPATHPMSGSTSGDRDSLQAARIELLNGNIDAAIRITRVISGKSARQGNKQVAGLLRNAAWIAPFGQIETASDLIHQAEAAL
jgi:hypothetical protein